jgi:hypothetical protein
MIIVQVYSFTRNTLQHTSTYMDVPYPALQVT